MITVGRLDAGSSGLFGIPSPARAGRRRPEPLDGLTVFEGRPTSGRWRSVVRHCTTDLTVSGGVFEAAPFQARPRPPYNPQSDVYANRSPPSDERDVAHVPTPPSGHSNR